MENHRISSRAGTEQLTLTHSQEPGKHVGVTINEGNHVHETGPTGLRNLLEASIPQSGLLLPSPSLIHADKRIQIEETSKQHRKVTRTIHRKKERASFAVPEVKKPLPCTGLGNKERDQLVKLRRCFEQHDGIESQTRLGEKSGGPTTDWDLINHESRSKKANARYHHHHIRGCKYNTQTLSRYLKHREVLGDYDIFKGKLGNDEFLAKGDIPIEEEESSSSDDSEEETDADEIEDEEEGEQLQDEEGDSGNPSAVHIHKSHHGHALHRKSTHLEAVPSRRSTISPLALQNPSHAHMHRHTPDFGGQGDEIRDGDSIDSTETWVLTWAYNGLTWTQTRDINQTLLNDAKAVHSLDHKRATTILESGLQAHRQLQADLGILRPQGYHHHHYHLHRLPEMYKSAIPYMSKVMREELRGTSAHYDLVFDNATLPIVFF